jgi:carboxymethylenebutenolidase
MAEPELDAAVIYYGHPIADPAALQPIKAAVVGIFGNLDESIPPSAVDEFDKALTTAGVEHVFHRYDAVHAFANPSNPRYDENAASDAWGKVTAFFREKLRG